MRHPAGQGLWVWSETCKGYRGLGMGSRLWNKDKGAQMAQAGITTPFTSHLGAVGWGGGQAGPREGSWGGPQAFGPQGLLQGGRDAESRPPPGPLGRCPAATLKGPFPECLLSARPHSCWGPIPCPGLAEDPFRPGGVQEPLALEAGQGGLACTPGMRRALLRVWGAERGGGFQLRPASCP